MWDNPVLHGDSLVDMVSANEDTVDAPSEDTDMLIDNNSFDEESRRGGSSSEEPTRGNRSSMSESNKVKGGPSST